MPSQAAINAMNIIEDTPDDDFIERLLVQENKRLRAQVTSLRNQLTQKQEKIDALQTQLAEVTQ